MDAMIGSIICFFMGTVFGFCIHALLGADDD